MSEKPITSLPVSWAMSELGELGKWTSGGTPSRTNIKFYQGKIPWIKSGDLPDGEIRRIDESISVEAIQASSAKIYPVGSLLVAMYGATIGKLGITVSPAASNQACAALLASELNREFIPYVFYFLLSQRDRLIELGQGGAQPNISQTILKVLPVPVAPAKEQQRIVTALDERLSELDASVASLERAERNLVRYRSAVLATACSGTLVPTEADLARRDGRSYEPADQLLSRILTERRKANTKTKYEEPAKPDTSKLLKLPAGWAWTNMDHLLTMIESGSSFKCDERPPEGKEIGVVKVSAVTWGTYDEQASKTCTDPERVDLTTLVKLNDFLFSRANTIELIGACVIAEHVTKRVMLSDKILRFHFAGVNQRWVLLCLRTAFGRSEIQQLSTGNQMSMRNIGQDRIRQIRVPMPPAAEITRILDEVDRHLSRADALATSIAQAKRRAQRLRRAILAAAFQGRLVPQDPNDEPASVLLERIRAQQTHDASASSDQRRASGPRSRGKTPRAAVAVATTAPNTMTPKRRGRPPGAKNKAKA